LAVAIGAGALMARAPKAANQQDSGKADSLTDAVAKLQSRCGELEKRAENSEQQVSWLSRTSPPVGTVTAFAGEWPPAKGEGGRWSEEELGWLLCDGRPWDDKSINRISRDALKELRAVLGEPGTLPDYQGRVLVAAGAGSGLTPRKLGESGGAETHTLTVAEIPAHDHGVTDPGHGHKLELGRTGKRYSGGGIAALDDDFRRGEDANKPPPPFLAKPEVTGITIKMAGGSQPHNNMQPFSVVNYIIKFR
jgi:microcystin-dependent protein